MDAQSIQVPTGSTLTLLRYISLLAVIHNGVFEPEHSTRYHARHYIHHSLYSCLCLEHWLDHSVLIRKSHPPLTQSLCLKDSLSTYPTSQ